MSKRVIELFLFDAFVAILKIEKTIERFTNSQELLYDFNAWDSVIREFEIIGEATKHLINNQVIPSDLQVVVDFRNLLTHNYFGIDSDEVWNVVKDDLPSFKDEIVDQIQKIEKNLKKELVDAYIESNRYLSFLVNELEKVK